MGPDGFSRQNDGGMGSQGRNSLSKRSEEQKLRSFRKWLHERLWDMRLSHQDKTSRAPTTRLHVTLRTPKSNQGKE